MIASGADCLVVVATPPYVGRPRGVNRQLIDRRHPRRTFYTTNKIHLGRGGGASSHQRAFLVGEAVVPLVGGEEQVVHHCAKVETSLSLVIMAVASEQQIVVNGGSMLGVGSFRTDRFPFPNDYA